MTKGEVCPDEVESAQIGPPRRPCQRKCVPSGKDAMRDLPIRPVRLSSGPIPEVIWGMSADTPAQGATWPLGTSPPLAGKRFQLNSIQSAGTPLRNSLV